MKFVTGDESGLIKSIFELTTVVDEKFEEIDLKKKEALVPPEIELIGKVDKSKGIIMMEWAEENAVVIGRTNGCVQVMDLNTKTVQKEYNAFDDSHAKDQIVGLAFIDGILISGTACGIVKYVHFKPKKDNKIMEQTISLGMNNLCRFTVHPCLPYLFAVGGKERELSVFDILNTKPNSSIDNLIKPIWQAENVENDELDMRVPVWVTDIKWLSLIDANKLIVSTGYAQIRVYDRKKQNRPIIEHKIGEFPIKNFEVFKNQVIFADTIGNLTAMAIEDGSVLGKYKGIAGSVTCAKVNSHNPFIACTSKDRFLRVYELDGKRKIVQKTYLKQRLNCLLIKEIPNDPQTHLNTQDESEEKKRKLVAEDDEVWKKLPQVGTSSKKSKSSKSAKQ